MTERTATRAIVIHCSASQATQDIGVREIRSWHLARGFGDIGYAIVIRRSGIVELGRSLTAVGAHVKGRNHDTVGVCLVGGLDYQGRPENNFTAAQFAALAQVVRFLKAIWPAADVCGHRDLSPDVNHDGEITSIDWLKACPCFEVREWVRKGMPVTLKIDGITA